ARGRLAAEDRDSQRQDEGASVSAHNQPPADNEVEDRNAKGTAAPPAARRLLFLLLGLLRLLFGGDLGKALGYRDQSIPVLLDVIRRAALVGDVFGHFRRRYHVDRVPGAPALAELAADAAFQIDIAEGLQARHVLA